MKKKKKDVFDCDGKLLGRRWAVRCCWRRAVNNISRVDFQRVLAARFFFSLFIFSFIRAIYWNGNFFVGVVTNFSRAPASAATIIIQTPLHTPAGADVGSSRIDLDSFPIGNSIKERDGGKKKKVTKRNRKITRKKTNEFRYIWMAAASH